MSRNYVEPSIDILNYMGNHYKIIETRNDTLDLALPDLSGISYIARLSYPEKYTNTFMHFFLTSLTFKSKVQQTALTLDYFGIKKDEDRVANAANDVVSIAIGTSVASNVMYLAFNQLSDINAYYSYDFTSIHEMIHIKPNESLYAFYSSNGATNDVIISYRTTIGVLLNMEN